MARLTSPVPIGIEFDNPIWIQFFEEIRTRVNRTTVYSSSADPTTTDIPSSTYEMWKNTTSGTVKLWTNDGGVMKSVTLV